MQKKSGRVRDIVVSNVEDFTDCFARYLCKEQIRYVQVENEFHYSDVILRFFSFEQYIALQDDAEFFKMIGNKFDNVPLILPLTLELGNYELSVMDIDGQMIDTYESGAAEKKVPVYTKRRIKQDNKMVNQRLKQNNSIKRIDRHLY